MNTQNERHRSPPGVMGYLTTVVLIMLAGGLGGLGAALLEGVPGPLGFWLTAGAIALAMAAALAITVLWWSRLDEAAREAHKWAWWWGGSVGLAIGGVALLTLQIRSEDNLGAVTASSSDLVTAGIVLVMLCQVVGYTVAWAFWWLRHR